MPHSHIPSQGELPFDEPPINWPPHQQFPYNDLRDPQITVDEVLGGELRGSANPLIITSYTSLDRVLMLLAHYEAAHRSDPEALRNARLVIGHEPSRARRRDFRDRIQEFGKDIAEYWLSRGISIVRSAHVLAAIECLRSGRVVARRSGSRVIHAKIYVTERSATLGSSNYSASGMRRQAEANCRFESDSEDERRYQDTTQVANAIWQEAVDYQADLQRLLERLLSPVDWREALARASAELLEGSWAEQYLNEFAHELRPALWPSQRAGIAQALWILRNTGSVLVADATGSGKTRMGAQLLLAARSQRIRSGMRRSDTVVIICPPMVDPQWRKELIACGLNADRHSHGILSNTKAGAREDTLESVRRASILAVDEAHHYLNRATKRTQILYRNTAEHVVLFTATPINRGSRDLISIIDLLGADNFDDEVLEIVSRAWKRPSRMPSADEQEQIRSSIQRFTVRRTKRILNKLVEREPDQYIVGERVSRYPSHSPQVYHADGTKTDRELAQEIRMLSSHLRGLLWLRKLLRVPKFRTGVKQTAEEFLEQRLKGARGLAAYHIMAALRSSRAALLENICGTQHARKMLGISATVKATNTGDAITKLRDISGKPPKSHLGIPLPDFLSDQQAHAQACAEEIELLSNIYALACEMYDSRQDQKTDFLLKLFAKHDRILAFDTYLITIHDLSKRLTDRGESRIRIATGESKSERTAFQSAFRRDSEERAIGLCSDALSEGINLQGASSIVLLDMPSVIRVAEQRIGRIDRMDSRYDKIEVFWPEDPTEFALRSNEMFLDREREVRALIGSNLDLPASLQKEADHDPVEVDHVWKLLEREEREAHDELGDAFYPVRSLVEGESAIITHDIYESVRQSRAKIRTAVSVVDADDRWSFYAIAGTDHTAPFWIYLDSGTQPITDLSEIARLLRHRLSDPPNPHELDERAANMMADDLAVVQIGAERLLPRRKRRALELLKKTIRSYLNQSPDDRRRRILRRLEEACRPKATVDRTKSRQRDADPDEDVMDLELLSDWWMDRIRGHWHEHLADPTRKKVARLKDLNPKLARNPISTEDLETFSEAEDRLYVQPYGNRVIAAIIGVPRISESLSPPAPRGATGGRS